MRLPALACPCMLHLSMLICTPSLRRAPADGPVCARSLLASVLRYHFIVKEAAQSVGVVRCTNPVLRHAHTSRAFDNGEPHLKSNRLKRQAFKLIYKNGAADRALHLIFVSRGNTHSAPRT